MHLIHTLLLKPALTGEGGAAPVTYAPPTLSGVDRSREKTRRPISHAGVAKLTETKGHEYWCTVRQIGLEFVALCNSAAVMALQLAT